MRPFLACLLALPALAANSSQVSIAPLSLTFTQQTGSIGSAVQAIFLASPQSGSYTISRPPSSTWLQLVSNSGGSALGGTLPDVIQVGVTTAQPGTYNTTVGFVTPAGTLPVNVTMVVTGLPVLVPNPGLVFFDYTGVSSTVPATQSVGVGITNGVPLLLSAKTTTPWLTVQASSPFVYITADPKKVPSDIATGTVQIYMPQTTRVANNPLVIPVVFLRNGLFTLGPNVTRMVNGATWLDTNGSNPTGISPGEIVTLGGTALGPATGAGLTLNPDGTVATTVAGVQVLFNGVPGPIVYASQNLVSAVAPYELAGSSTASVQVVYNGAGSNALSMPTAAAVPGIFTANSAGSGPGAILNQDNSVNSPANPAPKGSVVQVYATGEGQTNPQGITGAVTTVAAAPAPPTPVPMQAVTATIDGQPATVEFAGEAPGLVSGVLQVNVQVPQNAASGDLPLAISVGGISSQPGVTVSVR
jgi:uncharacterized protein (TIGR03437 family)